MKHIQICIRLVFFILIVRTGYAQNVPNYVPSDGLVLWMPFDGNADDESGNGNDGTVNGASLTTDKNGNSSSAYDFNGTDDYIEVDASSSLDISTISFSCWMKANSYNPVISTLLAKNDYQTAANEAYALGLRSSNQTYLGVKDFTCVPGQGWLTDLQSASQNFGNWTHIVYVYDNGNMSIYINGELNSSTNLGGAIDFCDNEEVIIGNEWIGGTPTGFDGVIDEVGIWDRDLDECEIIALYEESLISVDVSSTDETGNDFEDGTATAEAEGGTPPYEYEWSNGEDTETIEDLAPGEYTVTVTDAEGCIGIETVTVEEFICPNISIDYVQLNVDCYDSCTGELTIEDIINGEPPFTYEWSDGQSGQIAIDLCAGEYEVTVTDALNCQIVESFTITEPEELIVDVSSTDETGNDFEDGTATAEAEGGTPPYEYEWSNGEDTETIEDLAPGEYTVTVTDAEGCIGVETVTVEEFICPNISIDYVQLNVDCYDSCTGELTIEDIINGEPPFTYEWSDGQSGQIAIDLCAGEYEVTVTDALNCQIVESFTITEPEELIVDISSTDETGNDFEDGTATAEAEGGTPPYEYEWSNGEDTETIEDLAPGEYTVTVTDAEGCIGVETVTVEEFICPNISIDYVQLNVDCYDSCTGELTIEDIINGEPPFTYEWSDGQSGQIAIDLCAGEYEVTVTDALNCQIVESFTITEPEELIVDVSSTDETGNDFEDGTATAEAEGGTPPYEYEWSNGEDTETIEDLAPGEYTVTVTDDNNCEAIISVIVNEFGCTSLVIESNQIDVDCHASCTGEIAIEDIINGEPPFTYEWSDGQTTSSAENLCAGEYEVTVTDALNCQLIETFTITEPEEIVILVQEVNNVINGQLGSIILNMDGEFDYLWTNNNGFISTDEDIFDLLADCYYLELTDIQTQCSVDTTICIEEITNTSDLDEDQVSIYPNPAENNDVLCLDIESNQLNEVVFSLINIKGQIVKEFGSHTLESGKLSYSLNLNGVKSGVYFVVGRTQKDIKFSSKLIIK